MDEMYVYVTYLMNRSQVLDFCQNLYVNEKRLESETTNEKFVQ